jgi:hypothetical protein
LGKKDKRDKGIREQEKCLRKTSLALKVKNFVLQPSHLAHK